MSAAPEAMDPLHLEACDWLEKRDFGQWTEADQAEFETWLAQSPAHRIAHLRAEAGWKRTEMLAALRPFRVERPRAAAPHRKASWKIAAAIVVCGAVGAAGLFWLKSPGPQYTAYATAIGGHKTLALADGTRIELNTDTQVRLLNGDHRKVWLDKGEAYFQVHHDAAHPFEVMAGNHKVTDLGTAFFVKRRASNTEVALVEGSARFDDTAAGDARSLTLAPGDVVIASAKAVSLSRRKPAVLSAELSWRHGVLIFEQMTLSAIADELNRYNQKKLVIADAAAGRVKFGGTFATSDVQAVANAAREVFGLEVKDRGNEIVISARTGKGN